MYFAPDVKLFGAIDEIFIVRADIDNSAFIEYNIYKDIADKFGLYQYYIGG